MQDRLQAIYDLEINFHIQSFWDSGFYAAIGDPVNGFLIDDNFDNIEDAINFLYKEALQYYNEKQ